LLSGCLGFRGEPPLADSKLDTLTDARLIIEVLSPSTADHDRGFKFEQYRRLRSFVEYLIVAQDKVYIEHHTHQADGSWNLREIVDADGVVTFVSIQCSLVVSEAYERVSPKPPSLL
jgi:Uma2 family endonuclease